MAKAKLPDSFNICIIAEKFPIFGRRAEYGFLWPIARGLAKKGHKVTVLSGRNPLGKKLIQQDNVDAHFLGFDLEGRDDLPKRIYRQFQTMHAQTPFHIVHSIDANALYIGHDKKKLRVAMMYDVKATRMAQMFSILAFSEASSLSMIKTGIKVSYSYLTTFFGRDRKLLKSADGVFVSSPQQKLALERHYYYPESRTFTVPYGIEIGDLSPRTGTQELRTELGITANARVVVATSDFANLQEMINLFEAFEDVVIRKPSSHLVVVGDGPLFKEAEYEMLMRALGRRVTFVRVLQNNYELGDYIALADLFVNISSRSSGFDPSVLEAMAQQKIVVGSEMTPLTTIVQDGVNGYLIRPADVPTLIKLMDDALNGQLPTQSLGLEARKTVMEIFDPEKMVLQTVDAYHRTLLNSGFYRRS